MQHRQELQGAEAGAALPHPDELPGRLLHRRAQPPDAAGPQLPSRHHSPQAAAAAAYFAVHQDPRQGEPAAGASSSAGGHVAIRQDLRRAGTTADSGLAGVRVGLDVACFGDAPQDPRRGAATSGFSYDSGTIRVAKDAPYHAVAFAVRRGLQGGGATAAPCRSSATASSARPARRRRFCCLHHRSTRTLPGRTNRRPRLRSLSGQLRSRHRFCHRLYRP
jgi:hypothetical protein